LGQHHLQAQFKYPAHLIHLNVFPSVLLLLLDHKFKFWVYHLLLQLKYLAHLVDHNVSLYVLLELQDHKLM
jgi:hypothetical protein